MSRSFGAPRWGIGAVLAGALALVLMALLAVGPAPKADAAFTTGKCEGEDIVGRGASFARDAHKVFNFNFAGNYCIGTPGFESINVTYEPQGSGAGLTAVIDRGLAPRFGMSDDPPEPAMVAEMNAGGPGPEDDGKIHVIPAAVGAVAPLVNFPDACDPEDLLAAAKAPDFGDSNLIRVRFTKTQFEKAWAKDPTGDEWDEVFPELAGGTCVDVPIIRVVRLDKSGTTFAFKDYLNASNPTRKWLEDFTADNREWPNATLAHPNAQGCSIAAPGSAADTVDFLTSSCSSGNDDLTAKLEGTDGSIGYSDISTARTNSPSLAIDPEPPVGEPDNDIYWTQIQNGTETFTEPTASPEGFLEHATATYPNGGTKGSNCQAATFKNVPDTSLEDWSKVSGVNAQSGYGICTMTYGLVFDDNADVWGTGLGEEPKARTVKDYWENALSSLTQGQLFGNDYAPLPTQILNVAKAGIASIGWEKGEGGGGGGGNDDPPPPSGSPSNVTPPPPPPISNLFTLPRKTISSKTGQASVAVKIPGAGQVTLLGTAKVQVGGEARNKKRTRTIKVGRTVLNATGPGTFTLQLKPSRAAKKVLRRTGKLRVSLQVTFTPVGGTVNTTRSAVTLKMNTGKGKKRRSG